MPPPVLQVEEPDREPHWLDRIEQVLTALPNQLATRFMQRRLGTMCERVLELEPRFAALAEPDLTAETAQIRDRLRREHLTDAAVIEAFALIREVSYRRLALRHYPCQVLGGLVLIGGRVAEMNTGEGKTLTATLAVGAAALAGLPTHVVTVNDYLAARDADMLSPLYRALGLTVGVIKGGLTPAERREAYAADVTYCSNSELAFDYLRDRLTLGRNAGNLRLKVERLAGTAGIRGETVMRGLHFAVVDEADSVLIDEARTPLIIATETDPDEEKVWAETAFALADELEEGRDYRQRTDRRVIEITPQGKSRLAEIGEARGDIWRSRIRREEGVRQALAARLLFHRGDQYIVQDGKVQIVDEYSGRVMEDRSWNEGMHQLVEVKEGVEVTGRKAPSIRTSYQRFFRRYRRLAGMTGTAREVATEFRAVYRLNVHPIEPNRPSRRRDVPTRYLGSLADKRQVIATRAREVAAAGRPVLIGTRSIAASLELSAVLDAAGVSHQVLNAEFEAEEAAIIATAGEAGRVTVATNMAGRGVDIALGPGVEDAGGLHVILSERHDARRIDRQLAGRAGRQGDPGSFEAILSRDDPLLQMIQARPGVASLLRAAALRLVPALAFSRAQRIAERTHFQIRKDLLKMDDQTGSMLAFAGDSE
ncbi:MAG: prepilin peptidase [Hyphomicrobiales bacterium]